MICVAGAILLSVLACSVEASSSRGPVDCAFSVWGEWTPHNSGSFEQRTRDIIRQARNGGRPCIGDRAEFRPIGSGTAPVGSEEFFGNLLVGNTPSYSLGGGKRYTLSRDIFLAQDSAVNARIYPYYKSFISNIVGKICGKFGSQPEDNRMNIITFDSSAASAIHPFSYNQERELLQDIILRTRGSYPISHSDIKAAIDSARLPLVDGSSGIRRYNNATKEVLLVTTYREYCSRALVRSAERLKTTAEVYVIVVGRGETRRSPNNWCLKRLASTPVRSHFLQLDGITEISEESQTLLAQSPTNYFCLAN